MRTPLRLVSTIVFIGVSLIHAPPGSLLTPVLADPPATPMARADSSRDEIRSPEGCCIPSGNHTNIQNALVGYGARAVLCPDAVFELGETIFFTADGQSIYTQGFPTNGTRALLKIVGESVATAISAEGNHFVSLQNVIIDGSRPELGLADGALINFGRGVLDQDAEGQLVEWVKAYEPRGWTILYIGGPCKEAIARNNELGPAGHAEYIIADGISLECKNSIVENNTIVDATDGGIVIFQSAGSRISDNTIRTENRVMFYGISMEDYWPNDGDFTDTQVTGNVIDAAGSMIRKGISMGHLVGCSNPEEDTLRSRGAVVTGNTLRGDKMGYGFVVGGVEDWTATDNVDLSTHLTPEGDEECHEATADPPAGFQYDPLTSSGTFQPEFEAAVLASTTGMWPVYAVMSESCVSDLIGESLLESIRDGLEGDVWVALESAPNGRRIGSCVSVYEPPDISDLSGNVGVELQPCEPFCANLRLFNLSDETADLRRAEFLLMGIPVEVIGLPDSLGPWEEVNCRIDDWIAEGFQFLQWFGFRPDDGFWGFTYPFESEDPPPDGTESVIPRSFDLYQNYPNPFNPLTSIDYAIPEGEVVPVHLDIYDLRGRLVRAIVDGEIGPGRHTVHWDGRDTRGAEVSSGFYLYHLEAGSFHASGKMMMLR